MLSKTAETKPNPSAVGQLAAGSLSTGIIEAAVTSAKRKMVPLKVSGITDQSGDLHAAVNRITTHTAMPRTGMVSSSAGNFRLAVTLAASAATRMAATMQTLTGSILSPLGGFLTIGEKRCCCSDAGTAKINIATTAAT